jgi:hypothetical protein
LIGGGNLVKGLKGRFSAQVAQFTRDIFPSNLAVYPSEFEIIDIEMKKNQRGPRAAFLFYGPYFMVKDGSYGELSN